MPIAGTRYLRPGAYIGQIVRPNPAGLPDLPRLPILVGKGSRLARGRNLPLLRSFIVDETLAFTPVPPYRADLAFSCNKDKEDPDVRLVDDLGTEVLKNQWQFVDADTIEVDPTVYDANRTYTIDYQSSERTPLDPIPVDDIRGATRVSLSTDQDEFNEYEHFYIPLTMAAAGQAAGVLAPTVTNGAAIGAPVADGGNAGALVVAHDATSAYTHAYSRTYTIVCTARVIAPGASTAEFRWSSSPASGGNANDHHNPLDPSKTARWRVFAHDQAVADVASHTLEYGLVFNTDMTGDVDPEPGDQWTFTVQAAPRMEIDRRHLLSNQYVDLGTVAANTGNTGTGSGTVNVVTSNFVGDFVRDYEIECVASAGVTPNRTATLVVSAVGEAAENASVSFNLSEAIPSTLSTSLPGGVVVDWSFGAANFAAGTDSAVPVQPVRGDVFNLTVSPPRLFAKVKDDRSYVVRVTQITDLSPGVSLTGTFLTDTLEGGFGSFTALIGSYVNVTGSTTGLPDDVRLHARNIATAFGDNNYTVGDQFSFDITNDDVIDWSLVERKTETIASADWRFDPMGNVTGVINTWYVLLERVPERIITVNDGSVALTYTQVTGTGYIYVTAQPLTNTTVVYEWRAAEPTPGQTYYLTANYVRTSDLFNTPILVRTEEEARTLLAPMTGANDLLIGAEAAFHYGPNGIYVVQVEDADGNDVYEDADYRTAIAASELTSQGTDLIVLNRWSVLGEVLTSINKMNDPVEGKFRLGWIGAPQNTVVGDPDTAGSLIFTAQKTLAVHGEVQTHGTRILIGSTWAKRTIKLDSGQTQQVTLDGSFIAALIAGMYASFAAPWQTGMHQTFGFFDEIEIHSEAEDLALGGSQILYFSDLGGVFRLEEDFTTDNFAEQYRYINTMVTQHYMSRFVKREVDTAIGLVPPSSGEGADIVKGLVVVALRKAEANGIIAQYRNADGSPRSLNPDKDVIAYADPGNSTRAQFRYTFFLRYILKTAIGLYTTDGAPFDT